MQTSKLFEKRENILDAASSRAACKSQLLLASTFREDLFQWSNSLLSIPLMNVD